MANFDFHSVGAALTSQLAQSLAEEQARKRQALLDDLQRRQVESQMADRVTNRDIQTRQMAIMEANQQRQADAEEFNQLKTVTEDAQAKTPVDNPTVLRLVKAGLGGNVIHEITPGTQPGVMADTLPTDSNVLSPENMPGFTQVTAKDNTFLTPGPKYNMARQAAVEKAAQAQTDAEAKAAAEATAAAAKKEALDATLAQRETDNKRHDDTMRAVAAMGAAQTAGRAKDKADALAEEKAIKRRAVVDQTNDVLNSLDQLQDPNDPTKLSPLMQGYVGKWTYGKQYVTGTPEADAKALLDQIQGKLVLDLMGELKSQSRSGATGFGALSGPELKLLIAAAGRLDANQGPTQFLKGISEIRGKLEKILQEPGAPSTPALKVTTPANWTRGADGKIGPANAAPSTPGVIDWVKGPDGKLHPK